MTPAATAPLSWAQLVTQSGLPRLDARALLEHVSGQRREWLMAHDDDLAPPAVAEAFLALAHRRAQGEPLAYLIGWREFYGRPFQVTPAVLIPRPETELLVEATLARLPHDSPPRVLELGTGSGAIAVTLALSRPDATLLATDLSAAALAVAQRNAQQLGAPHIGFHQGDWWHALPTDARDFDAVVANPPYIAAHDPHLNDAALRHEPTSALTSGPSGLEALITLIQGARHVVRPGGWLLLEHGYDQGAAVRAQMQQAGWQAVATLPDLQQHDRVTLAQRPAA